MGYDIRKGGGNQASPLGSHCSAAAPRFNIQTTTNRYFVGCDTGTIRPTSNGWLRLGWGGGSPATPIIGFCLTCTPAFSLQPVTGTVVRIQIVFDEGQDASPDYFGAAFLDNIDVNGALVGHGATDASTSP